MSNEKKYFEEAHFSVKPHNSITNEEFYGPKDSFGFFSHYYHMTSWIETCFS